MANTKLNDSSIMTFGKYKGRHLRQVPDDYLVWMWQYQLGGADLLEYIKDNLDNLR